MKTTIFLFTLLLGAASLFAANDPVAVQLLQKAAEIHGLNSPKRLVSFEMETVYSGVSGGIPTASKWLERVDFDKKLDLGIRFVYDETSRGVLFQRRIEGNKGRFMYGLGTQVSYDLGSFYGGNAVLALSGVSLLAVRNELQDLKYLGKISLGVYTLDQVQFAYHDGTGIAFFLPDGRYAGHMEIDLKDNIKIYEVATSFEKIDGLLVPSRFNLYDNSKSLKGYGKLLTFRANPALSNSDFEMKPSASDRRGLLTPFGLALVPSDPVEFTGLKVGPQKLNDPARPADLVEGNEIIAIKGKDARKADFFELESLFWSEKELEISVMKSDKKVDLKLIR